MSFAIRPSDPGVQDAFRRIAQGQLAAALRTLHRRGDPVGPAPAAVHALRKRTKKLRGLLRLVRPVFPGFDPANAALRDSARHLADLRDAEVRLATFRTLAAGLPSDPLLRAADPLLAAEVAGLCRADRLTCLVTVLAAELDGLRRQAADWHLTARDWAALEPGLRATLRRCRKGLKTAARARARGGGAAPFHDWRKAVKHHWYQARLLEPVAPADLAPRIAALDALAEDLGDHNDLDLLLAHLAAHPDRRLSTLAAEGPFLRAARAARGDLARRALERGAALFAEPPGALLVRWRAGWRDWRQARPQSCPDVAIA